MECSVYDDTDAIFDCESSIATLCETRPCEDGTPEANCHLAKCYSVCTPEEFTCYAYFEEHDHQNDNTESSNREEIECSNYDGNWDYECQEHYGFVCTELKCNNAVDLQNCQMGSCENKCFPDQEA